MSVTIRDHGVRAYLEGLPSSMFQAAKQAISSAVANTHERVVTNTALHRRTGALMRSIHTETHGGDLRSLGGSVFSRGTRYASIQETGGVVRAKRAYRGVPGGAYLNIPLPLNKTASGATRKTARQVFQAGGTIVKSRRGNYIVLSNIGTPMFVLKKQVTIPARLGMQKAADDEIAPLMVRMRELAQGAIQ